MCATRRRKRQLMGAVELITKVCTQCGEDRPLSEYHRNRRNPDGHQYECKPCANRRLREYQKRRRDEIGEEAWLELGRQMVAKSRTKAEVRDRCKRASAAYFAALFALRDLHRDQFDRLLAAERYERGLD